MLDKYIINLKDLGSKDEENCLGHILDLSGKKKPEKKRARYNATPRHFQILSLFLLVSMLFGPVLSVYAEEVGDLAEVVEEVTEVIEDQIDENIILEDGDIQEEEEEILELSDEETAEDTPLDEIKEDVSLKDVVVDGEEKNESTEKEEAVEVEELIIEDEVAKDDDVEQVIEEETSTTTPEIIILTATTTDNVLEESIDEEIIETEEDVLILTATTTDDVLEESVDEEIIDEEDLISDEAIEIFTIEEDTDAQFEDVASSTASVSIIDTVEEDADAQDEIVESSATSTPVIEITEEEDIEIQSEVMASSTVSAPATVTVVEEISAQDDTASSTTPAPNTDTIIEEETAPLNISFNDGNKYVFNDKECILARENEFYCIQSKNKATTTQAVEEAGELVLARQDSDGDREIFLNLNGEEIQITDNLDDDSLPFYNRERGLAVWQSLINDRYQIMLYIVATGETRQITDSLFNNTNPQIYGETIVWQGWIGNGWEILVMENVFSGAPTVKQITDNNYHDMFPKIYERLITWQAFVGDSWEVFIYNLDTGETLEVDGGEGSFEAPRFVLLMENRKDNGDIEKVGYDISSGEKFELGVSPQNPAPQNPIVPDSPLNKQGDALPVEAGTTTVKIQQRDEGE